MECVIHHNSTVFMLYYMNMCAYLTILLVDSNNIYKIPNSETCPKLNATHN